MKRSARSRTAVNHFLLSALYFIIAALDINSTTLHLLNPSKSYMGRQFSQSQIRREIIVHLAGLKLSFSPLSAAIVSTGFEVPVCLCTEASPT